MDIELSLAVSRISKDLKLPNSFLNNLLKEDDWSFIIKSHFLMEGSLSYLLTIATDKEELLEVFSSMDMKDKIDAAKSMQLLDKDYRRVLRSLSNLRNKLAHRIENVGFSFKEYLSDKRAKEEFINNFSLWKDKFEISGKTVTKESLSIENPKLTIFITMLYILGEIDLTKQIASHEKEKYDYKEEYYKKLSEINNLFLKTTNIILQNRSMK